MKNKCAAELLGTFALVFVGCGSIIVNGLQPGNINLIGIAFAFGLIVMAAIYSIGEISGAHINPAVSVGLCLAGRFPAKSVIPYVISQLAGATLACVVLHFLFSMNTVNLGATLPTYSVKQSFVLEIFLTAFLMFVILGVTTGSKETGTLAGIAIGSVVAMNILFGGPISGASMNPARSFGPAIVSGHLVHLWIYLTAPFIGSALGVVCWKIIHCQPKTGPD